jgi:ribosomal protein L44E
MINTQTRRMRTFGQKCRPAAMAAARTARSWKTARLARQAERRVRRRTISFGSALR